MCCTHFPKGNTIYSVFCLAVNQLYEGKHECTFGLALLNHSILCYLTLRYTGNWQKHSKVLSSMREEQTLPNFILKTVNV